MRVRRLLAAAICVAASIVVSSCASDNVPFSEPVAGEGSPAGTPAQVASIAIVNDVCLVRDESNYDYWVVEDSRSAGSYMLVSAVAAMKARGYDVSFQLSPFVGSFLSRTQTLEVADTRGGDRHTKEPPFYVSDSIVHDDEYVLALSDAIELAVARSAQHGFPLTHHADVDSTVSPDWELLGERAGTDYLLVLAASGVSVSGVKQAGEGCFGSCISYAVDSMMSAIVAGICSTVTRSDVEPAPTEPRPSEEFETPSVLRTVAVLFDLSTGESAWASSHLQKGVDPLSKRFYESDWVKTVLDAVPLLAAPGS